MKKIVLKTLLVSAGLSFFPVIDAGEPLGGHISTPEHFNADPIHHETHNAAEALRLKTLQEEQQHLLNNQHHHTEAPLTKRTHLYDDQHNILKRQCAKVIKR